MASKKAQQHISNEVRKAFAMMDKDGDGQVTFSEFREFCAKTVGLEGVAEAFCEIDTSDDCRIDLEELNDICTKQLRKGKVEECHIRALFKEMDTSGDGQLDRKEFKAALEKGGYPDKVLNEVFDHVAGDDGLISVDEFLKHWH